MIHEIPDYSPDGSEPTNWWKYCAAIRLEKKSREYREVANRLLDSVTEDVKERADAYTAEHE